MTNEHTNQTPNAELQSLRHRLSALENTAHRPPLAGAPANELEHKSFSTFLRTGDMDLDQKSLSLSVEENGAYLVPSHTMAAFNSTKEQVNPLRQLAMRTTISTSQLEVVHEVTQAQARWSGETNTTLQATDAPTLSKTIIKAQTMYAKPQVSQQLLDDSNINIEEWISQRVATQMGRLEAQAFLNGDGNEQPRGIIHYMHEHPGAIETFSTGSDTGFDADNPAKVLFKALDSLETKYHSNACWLMSRHTQSALRQLVNSQSGHTLWQNEQATPGRDGFLNGKPCPQLLGYPVVVMDEMPALDSGNPAILFGSFKDAYHIVERQGMHVLRDPYSAKPMVEFYMTQRVGGAVVNPKALKAIHATS